jgi:hypothetical protein
VHCDPTAPARPLSGEREVANEVAPAQLAPECRDPNRHPAPGWEDPPRGHIQHSHGQRRYQRSHAGRRLPDR